MCHLHEHSAAVNEIAVSSDGVYFVTGSDDGTVKVWDSELLECECSGVDREREATNGSQQTT